MSELAVEKIYRQISKLRDNDKKVLLSKLITEMSTPDKGQSKLNIYDLKGVGKEIWDDIDAQEYIDTERSSWE